MAEGVVTTDDGVRLWFAVDGPSTAPALLLTHGGPGLADDLGPLAALLGDGVAVVRWHQRGVGRSDPVGPHAIDRYVADMEAIRAHLGLEAWMVGGHSFGATLALRYALAHPRRTRALLDVSGVGTGQAWRRAFRIEADRRLDPAQRRRRDELAGADRTPAEELEWRTLHWLPEFADAETARDKAAAMAAATGPICWEANAALGAEVRADDERAILQRCRHLDVPALLLHGGADPRPASALVALADALPQAHVDVIAGAGHRPWVEAPGAVRQAVLALLRRLGGPEGHGARRGTLAEPSPTAPRPPGR